MYAIFTINGKQHIAEEGKIIRLEKINIEIGKVIKLDQILMIVDRNIIKIGNPFLYGIKIEAEIINHGREDKIMIIKLRRRKHSRKHQGHRQYFTDIKITNIIFNGDCVNGS